MRVIAIDIGARHLGIAVCEITDTIRNILIKEHWHLKENKIELRLLDIEQRLSKLIKEFKVDSLAFEAPYMRQSSKTAMDLYFVSGVCAYTSAKHNLPLSRYSAAEVKLSAASTGRAEKLQVQNAVIKYFDLKEKFKDSHSADAVAVAITHYNKTTKSPD